MKKEFYYKLAIQFKGTKYLGWQIQKDFGPTVQGELNRCIIQIFKSNDIHTIGSGRTDTGVHSLSHIVKLRAPFHIEFEGLRRGLNAILPKDIRVLSIYDCDPDFLPTNDAESKEYRYLFSVGQNPSAFQIDCISNTRFEVDEELMKKACASFMGKHDFSDFQCVGTDVSSSVREIFECELIKQELDFHGILPSHYVFRVVGNGFLKQMVRLMVGCIWDIGRGKTSLDDLEASMVKPLGRRLGPVAPPEGLYKFDVQY